MNARLFSREVLPFYGALIALVVATLLGDAALHRMNAVWIGRWLGIPGTLLILGSLGWARDVTRTGVVASTRMRAMT